MISFVYFNQAKFECHLPRVIDGARNSVQFVSSYTVHNPYIIMEALQKRRTPAARKSIPYSVPFRTHEVSRYSCRSVPKIHERLRAVFACREDSTKGSSQHEGSSAVPTQAKTCPSLYELPVCLFETYVLHYLVANVHGKYAADFPCQIIQPYTDYPSQYGCIPCIWTPNPVGTFGFPGVVS